jgi:hypothetical protein
MDADHGYVLCWPLPRIKPVSGVRVFPITQDKFHTPKWVCFLSDQIVSLSSHIGHCQIPIGSPDFEFRKAQLPFKFVEQAWVYLLK